MKDLTQAYVAARYGALFDDSTNRDRRVFADVRVGSHEIDNSVNEEFDFNFSLKGTSYTTRKEAPLDDDLTALRTALWLITDEKYKTGLFNLLKKKGEAVYVVDDPKKPPSFSREQPQHVHRAGGELHLRPGAVDGAGAEAVGALQRGREDLRLRRAGDRGQGGPRTSSTRKGRASSPSRRFYGVHIYAVTRADDGQLLDDSRDYYGFREAELPSDDKLMKDAESLIQELLALRAAPAIDPYTGPAILEPRRPGCCSTRRWATGSRATGRTTTPRGRPSRARSASAVLPPFLTIVDDPTRARRSAASRSTATTATTTRACRRSACRWWRTGVLKNFLLSRHPVEGFLQSQRPRTRAAEPASRWRGWRT